MFEYLIEVNHDKSLDKSLLYTLRANKLGTLFPPIAVPKSHPHNNILLFF